MEMEKWLDFGAALFAIIAAGFLNRPGLIGGSNS